MKRCQQRFLPRESPSNAASGGREEMKSISVMKGKVMLSETDARPPDMAPRPA